MAGIVQRQCRLSGTDYDRGDIIPDELVSRSLVHLGIVAHAPTEGAGATEGGEGRVAKLEARVAELEEREARLAETEARVAAMAARIAGDPPEAPTESGAPAPKPKRARKTPGE